MNSVKLPKTLKYIGDYAFYECYNLKSIEIPNGVISIGKSAFKSTKMNEITIPSSVTEIGDDAFYNSYSSVVLKIKNEEGAVKFGRNVVDSNDKVEYLGKGFFSKLFGK